MSLNNRLKKHLVIFIAFVCILTSVLSPALTTFADLSEAEKIFTESSDEFLKDAENARDILDILDDDAKANPSPKRNTINFVMRRLFYPGVYVNDVRDGVLSTSIEGKKSDFLTDGKYSCNPNAPNNLLNHNCNIPNFTTGLIQNISEPFIQPFENAEKTSSYSVFGLGVPSNIPGDIVPVNPNERNHTYTALELFGYNLQLTSYNGEWDQIVVSNSARMLSNFGVIDNITLMGTTLWNSIREGVSEFIENFSFNPTRWFTTAASAFETTVSAGINTLVDTSELNIIATNEWKRPNLDKTLYGVYVMSDKELLQETMLSYFTIFSDELDKKADSSEELAAVIARNPHKALSGIGFVFDPNMETEESKKARADAEEKRAAEKAANEEERRLEKYYQDNPEFGDYTANIVPLTPIPEPEYYTESEQLGFWYERPDVKPVINDAIGEHLLTKGTPGNYETYEDLIADWEAEYTPYFSMKFNAQEETIKEILEKNDVDVFQNHPYLDPKQGISRYACAKSDGSIMRKDDGSVEYLYLDNNKGSKESLNPKCSSPRPPIGGGLLGTGWKNNKIDDTRHISRVSGDDFFASKFSNAAISFTRSLNSFIAKFTNVVIGLSFAPLLETLGINTIISNLVNSFRDTIFFPLVGLVASLGALLTFFQLIKNGRAWQLLASIGFTILIFIAGTAFMLYPNSTLKLIDEFPSKVDNFVADAVLGEEGSSSYCSTGKDESGVRSAQCSVWGALVFEPWVHLQFGTGYDNLYAKGFAPNNGSEFDNKNGDLIGDASVDMGAGKVINNWAMFQLDKTKSGTINSHDNMDRLGVVDNNLYRLVDLQAGPSNGALSDARYFDSWSGSGRSGATALLTLIQAILLSFAIVGLGFVKIEVSFMFSMTVLFLPFMLLYAMLPKGKAKLKGYLAGLVSLLIKRALIVVMLSVMLKIIIAIYSGAGSLEVGAIASMFVSLAFIVYRKELLNMITSTENGIIGTNDGQMKEIAGMMVPKYVKQRYTVIKGEVQGAVAGATGGALGAAGYKASIRARKLGIMTSMLANNLTTGEDKEIRRSELAEKLAETNENLVDMKGLSSKKAEKLRNEQLEIMEEINANERKINQLEKLDKEAGERKNQDEIEKLEKENLKLEQRSNEIRKVLEAGERDGASIFASAKKGFNHSREIIGRTAERKIRREGYAPLSAYKDVRDSVYAEGARKISEMEEKVAHDVYQEILSHTETNKSKSTDNSIEENERGELTRSPEIQKKIRRIAKRRMEDASSENFNPLASENKDVEKVAEIIDKKREKRRTVLKYTNPIRHKKEEEQLELRKERQREISSKVEDVRATIDNSYNSRKESLEEEKRKLITERYKKAMIEKEKIMIEKEKINEMKDNYVEEEDNDEKQ